MHNNVHYYGDGFYLLDFCCFSYEAQQLWLLSCQVEIRPMRRWRLREGEGLLKVPQAGHSGDGFKPCLSDSRVCDFTPCELCAQNVTHHLVIVRNIKS